MVTGGCYRSQCKIYGFQTGCGKVKKEKRSDFEYSYFREWGDSLLTTYWMQI